MSQLKRGVCQGLMVSIFGLMVAVPLGAAAPQADQANWDNLKQLVSGQEIQIVLKDSKSFQGRFQSVSDEALVIRLSTGEQTFNQQSVLRVSSKGQGHRGRNTLIGLAVGAGAGLAVGAAYGASIRKEWPHNRWYLVLIAPGAVVGTVVGALLPTSGGWRDVYRAR
jgi:hypothetical protein